MEKKVELVLIVAIAILAIGGGIATGFISFSFGKTEEHSSLFTSTTGKFITLVNYSTMYEVNQFEADPYMGPYEFHWDFGDGVTTEGSNLTYHDFMYPGIYHVTVLVSGRGDWSRLLTIGDTTVIERDSLNLTVIDIGVCDWNETFDGNIFLNVTIHNNENFALQLCKYSFGLTNVNGDYFEATNNQTEAYADVLAGGNLTWTLFYLDEDDTPVKISYFDLIVWPIEWDRDGQ